MTHLATVELHRDDDGRVRIVPIDTRGITREALDRRWRVPVLMHLGRMMAIAGRNLWDDAFRWSPKRHGGIVIAERRRA